MSNENSQSTNVGSNDGLGAVVPLTTGKRYINVHEGTDLPPYFMEDAGKAENFTPYELVPSKELETLRIELLCAEEELKKSQALVGTSLELLKLDAQTNERSIRLGLGAHKPRAWLCELAEEDGSVRTQIVEQDPDGLRFNDEGEPSPFSVTPLYTRPPGPVYVVEYGAISLPIGHESRITGAEVFATREEAERFAAEGDHDSRVLLAVDLGA